MDSENLILTLPQVIDIAAAGPELGIICFTLLHNILQVICQQTNLGDIKLQYSGAKAQQIRRIFDPQTKRDLPVVTDVKKTKIPSADEEKIVIIPDGATEQYPAVTVVASNSQLKAMEEDIKELKKDIKEIKGLPTNLEIFKSSSAKEGEPKPLSEMVQALTSAKRIDALEEAVVKMADYTDDLTKFIKGEKTTLTTSVPKLNGFVGATSRSASLASTLSKASSLTSAGKPSSKTKTAAGSKGSIERSDESLPADEERREKRRRRKKKKEGAEGGGKEEDAEGKEEDEKGETEEGSETEEGPETEGGRKPKKSRKRKARRKPEEEGGEPEEEGEEEAEGDKSAKVTVKKIKRGAESEEVEEAEAEHQTESMQHIKDTLEQQSPVVSQWFPKLSKTQLDTVVLSQIDTMKAMDIMQEELLQLRAIAGGIIDRVEKMSKRRAGGSPTKARGARRPGKEEAAPEEREGPSPPSGEEELSSGEEAPKERFEGDIQEKYEGYERTVEEIGSRIEGDLSEQKKSVEGKVNQCVKQINKIDKYFSKTFSTMSDRISDMESIMKSITNTLQMDAAKPDLEEQLTHTIYTLNAKVEDVEGELSRLTEAVTSLLSENADKQQKIEKLLDNVEMLKTEKVGREEFLESMSEKVDMCMVNKKVSHDQFNATCDDLSRGIEETLEKLCEQEELWNEALKEVQEEINEKLAKEDLNPLTEFMTSKLRGLQARVKAIAKLKKEQEAAASKSQFIKGVQCLSCDKDVIMRKKVDEALNFGKPPSMLPQKSIGPYLAYDLDHMRKQQQSSSMGKNMLHLESAVKDIKGAISRYCGGAHTITTPRQRVSKLGNFLEQWGTRLELTKYNPCHPCNLEECPAACGNMDIAQSLTVKSPFIPPDKEDKKNIRTDEKPVKQPRG